MQKGLALPSLRESRYTLAFRSELNMADAPAQPPAPQPIANVNVAAVSANLRNMADLFPVVRAFS